MSLEKIEILTVTSKIRNMFLRWEWRKGQYLTTDDTFEFITDGEFIGEKLNGLLLIINTTISTLLEHERVSSEWGTQNGLPYNGEVKLWYDKHGEIKKWKLLVGSRPNKMGLIGDKKGGISPFFDCYFESWKS